MKGIWEEFLKGSSWNNYMDGMLTHYGAYSSKGFCNIKYLEGFPYGK